MSATLPVSAVVTGEYRALTLYDAAPADCGAVLVPDDAFAPHLKAGEIAIVDPEDNEPIAGEIYLVTIDSPREPDGIVLRLVQLRPRPCRSAQTDEEVVGWMMHFSLIRPRPPGFSMEELLRDLRSGRERLCDGPLSEVGMRRKIVGRLIGVVIAEDD